MKRKQKRWISILICIAMVFSTLGMSGMTASATWTGESSVSEEQAAASEEVTNETPAEEADKGAVQCNCEVQCTAKTRNTECPVCGEGSDLNNCQGKPETENVTVLSFEALAEEAAKQEFEIGTELSELNLPESLKGKCSESDEVVDIPVTWSASPEYDGAASGEYHFSPCLAEGYVSDETLIFPEIVVQVGKEAAEKSGEKVTLTYSQDQPFTLDPSKTVGFRLTYTPENNGKDKVIELQLPRYFDLLEVPPNTELMTIEKTETVLGADEFWAEETRVDSLRIMVSGTVNTPVELPLYMEVQQDNSSVRKISRQLKNLGAKAPELPFELKAVLDEGDGEKQETKQIRTPEFKEEIAFTTLEQPIEKLFYRGDNEVSAGKYGTLSYDEYIMRLTLENNEEFHYPIQIDKIVVPCSDDIESMELYDKEVKNEGEVSKISGKPYAVFEFTGNEYDDGEFWDYTDKIENFSVIPTLYKFKESAVKPSQKASIFGSEEVEVTYTYLGEQKTVKLDTSKLKLEDEYYPFSKEVLPVKIDPEGEQNGVLNRENTVSFFYSYKPEYIKSDTKHIGENKIAPTYQGEYRIEIPYEFRPTVLDIGYNNGGAQVEIVNIKTNKTRTEETESIRGRWSLPEVSADERIQTIIFSQTFESGEYDGHYDSKGQYFHLFGNFTETKENGDAWKLGDVVTFKASARSIQPRLEQTFDVSASYPVKMKVVADKLIFKAREYAVDRKKRTEILLNDDGKLFSGTGIAIYTDTKIEGETKDYTNVRIDLGYTGDQGQALFRKMNGISLGQAIWNENHKNSLGVNVKVHYQTNLGKEVELSAKDMTENRFVFQLEEGEFVTNVWITMDRINGAALDRGAKYDDGDMAFEPEYLNKNFVITPLFSKARTYYDENGNEQPVPASSSNNPWIPGQITYQFTCNEGGIQQEKGPDEVESQIYRPQLYLAERCTYQEHGDADLKIATQKVYYGALLTLKDTAAVTLPIDVHNKVEVNSVYDRQKYELYLELAPGYEVLPGENIKILSNKKLENGNTLCRIEIEKKIEMEVQNTEALRYNTTEIQVFARPDAAWDKNIQPVVGMAHNYAPYFESVYGKTQEEMAQKPPYRVIESFKQINEIPEYWGLTAEEKTYTEYSEISKKVGTDTSAAGVINDYPFVEEKLTETGKFTNAQKDSLALRSYIHIDDLGKYKNLTVEYSLPTVGSKTTNEKGEELAEENEITLLLQDNISVKKQDETLEGCKIVYLDQQGKEYDQVTAENKATIGKIRVTFPEGVKGVPEVRMNLSATELDADNLNTIKTFIGVKAYGSDDTKPTYIKPVPFQRVFMKVSAMRYVVNSSYEFVPEDKMAAYDLKLLDKNKEEIMISDGAGGTKPVEFEFKDDLGVKYGTADVPENMVYLALKDPSTAEQQYVPMPSEARSEDEIDYCVTSDKKVLINGEEYYYIKVSEDYILEAGEGPDPIPLDLYATPEVEAENLFINVNEEQALPCKVTNEEVYGSDYELIYELLDDQGNVIGESEIASVDGTGNVTGKKEGIVRYRVTARNEVDRDTYISASAEAKIIVGNPPVTGDLTVSKTVAGSLGEKDRDFHFTVKLSDPSIRGKYGDLIFVDGEADFTLKHGESKTAKDLPGGVTYEVTETEANREGYTTEMTGQNGTIVLEGAKASFTNTKEEGGTPDPGPSKKGSLTISKVVAGEQGEKDRDFHFNVTLEDSSIGGTYGDLEFTNGTAVCTLKHGEKKTASDLPVGLKYMVTETEENQDGYTTSMVGAAGTISEEGASAAFTNTKSESLPNPEPSKTGNLTVSNVVSGNQGNPEHAFAFKVTLSDPAVEGTYGDMSFKAGTAVFKLKHGESMTAENLPESVEYTVEESDNEGYTVTKTGEIGVIKANDTAIAQFVNHKSGENPPSKPDTDKPVDPEPPTDPNQPDTPEKPENPIDPNQPDTPENPTDPDQPENQGTPTDPNQPENSNKPTDLDQPGDSGQSEENTSSEKNTAKTGDESHLSLWIVLFTVACMTMISVAALLRKRRKN